MHPVYLVKSDDPSLLTQAARSLVKSLVQERSAELVLEEIGEDADISAVLDACQTPAFLSDRRVVVVRSAGRFRADEVDPLIAYLKAPMPTTSLVLLGGGGALPTRLLKAIKEHGHVVDASAPTGKARQGWLNEKLKSAPVKLDRRATDLVASKMSDNLAQINGMLDALASAFGEGASISAEQLEPYLGASSGDAAPWDLTDAIDSGDTELALTHLHRMLDGGGRHPLVVAATLQRHVTTLLRLDGSNVTNEAEAAALLGMAPYPAKKALAQCRRLGSGAIRRAVVLVAEADVDLRGKSSWPNELVLDVLVARLSKLAPNARKAQSSRKAQKSTSAGSR
jgi:DNA polymerase-3 subunit delta